MIEKACIRNILKALISVVLSVFTGKLGRSTGAQFETRFVPLDLKSKNILQIEFIMKSRYHLCTKFCPILTTYPPKKSGGRKEGSNAEHESANIRILFQRTWFACFY